MRPWQEVVLPDTVTAIPSMLHHEERQYLTWLAAEKFEGWGAIVELGAWLGSSSAALAEGLRRGNAEHTVHSFDRFLWEGYMSSLTGTGLRDGDDFLPLFLDHTREYSRWIAPRRADINNCSWDGRAIEMLFVDCAGTWETANAVLRQFGPRLLPGRSRIVLRDFRYFGAPWLPLIFDSRPDLWKQLEDVEEGHAVTFVPLKPLLGPSGIDSDYAEDSFPLPSAEHVLRSRIEREQGANRNRMCRTLYRLLLTGGPLEAARELKAEVLSGGIAPSELAALESVESTLLPRGWRAIQKRDYAGALRIAERCREGGSGSIYSLTLSGYALLHLGRREEAVAAIDEVLRRSPGHAPARLFRVEMWVLDGRYAEAEVEAVEILRKSDGDETTIQVSLRLLTQAWDRQHALDSRLPALRDLAGSFGRSPSFLAHLAREQFMADQAEEAIKTVDRALQIAPGHELAGKVLRRIGWARLRERG